MARLTVSCRYTTTTRKKKFCFPMFLPWLSPSPLHFRRSLRSDVMRWILLSQYWLQSENCRIQQSGISRRTHAELFQLSESWNGEFCMFTASCPEKFLCDNRDSSCFSRRTFLCFTWISSAFSFLRAYDTKTWEQNREREREIRKRQ